MEEIKKAPEGAITSSYDMGDGVELKVRYSFSGSIYGKEEEEAVISAMKQDSLTNGPQVAAFQQEFADYCGVRHALAVSNCTTAMHVATQAFGIGPGDEVIVTPNTFVSTSLVVLLEGGTPIYADIDPRTYNIDPARVREKVTEKTKAIYVVHYGGQMVDMDPIMEIARENNLFVLEDCAHTPGAEYKGRKAGSIGDIGAFSFHSLKNMSTCGEGGMITTNRDDLAEAVSRLRNMTLIDWEEQPEYWLPSHFDVVDHNGKWGNNYRMNEIQAAVGRAQLRKLDALNAKRREIGRYVNEGIKDIKGLTPVYEDPNCTHIYHLYTLCVEEEILGASRDDFLRALYYKEGIQGILHYQPTYHFTGFRNAGHGNHSCPNAEKFFYKRELNLPMHPRLTQKDLDTMILGIKNAAESVRK